HRPGAPPRLRWRRSPRARRRSHRRLDSWLPPYVPTRRTRCGACPPRVRVEGHAAALPLTLPREGGEHAWFEPDLDDRRCPADHRPAHVHPLMSARRRGRAPFVMPPDELLQAVFRHVGSTSSYG